MEVINENIQRKLPGQDILKLFRIIAESNDKERINATKRLLNHLQEQQADGGKARKLVILIFVIIIYRTNCHKKLYFVRFQHF